jgi:uridine kinase
MTSAAASFTVALAGGSGSGKTTLARALCARLGPHRCTLLDHDSYYRDLAHLSAERRAQTNFDHPASLDSELLARHLAELRAGRAIVHPRYDFATHTRCARGERVEPRPFVVCEGILLLAAPELAHAFDLRVFLDVPADVRVLRRLRRDLVERGRTVESVIAQYMTTVRPMHERFVAPARASADLVLDWRPPIDELVGQVLARLAEQTPAP